MIIGLTGAAGIGKDSVVDILVNEQLRKALSRANGQQDEKEDCDNV